ncbi:hypothetical protein [Foetidibacter luteolus]|uniref:hypothetical protein n=1 Tax=Foetidibacter luteolus TaxID=2608880 RepID=UPI00129B361C|nr:hypothetical protein [Foetidibacter luteolus]
MKKKNVFGNLFSSTRITETRLYNFGNDVVIRLQNSDNSSAYAAHTAQLEAALLNLGAELRSTDNAVNSRKGKTQQRREIIQRFKVLMSEKEGLLAHLLGGFASPGYLSFYPNGVSEYSKATITKMAGLVKRVNEESSIYIAQLGQELATQLQVFDQQWRDATGDVSKVKASVSESGINRRGARENVEKILNSIVHEVAQQFGGDEEQCMAFFDFTLLYPPVRKRGKGSSGDSETGGKESI